MRLIEVSFADFKGVEVRLPWKHINVLFGPNDAGKTNILEGVSSAFGEPDLLRPSDAGRSNSPQLRALIELEHGETDDELLAALLQFDHVEPIFPIAARHPRGGSGGARRVESTAPRSVSPARLRWCGGDSKNRSFALVKSRRGSDAGVSSRDLEPLNEVKRRLHERALRAVKERTRDAPETWADVEVLLTACLKSRRLLFEKGNLTLLCPALEDCDDGAMAAAVRLAKNGWRTDMVLGPFVTTE